MAQDGLYLTDKSIILIEGKRYSALPLKIFSGNKGIGHKPIAEVAKRLREILNG